MTPLGFPPVIVAQNDKLNLVLWVFVVLRKQFHKRVLIPSNFGGILVVFPVPSQDGLLTMRSLPDF